MTNKLFIVAILVSVSWASVCAERIVLQSGVELTGPVLSDRSNQVVVDLGFTVLLIPKEKIVSIEKETPESSAAEQQSAEKQQAGDSARLYRTSDLKPQSLQQCYKKASPAVVKVSTPAGLGSGFIINENGFVVTNDHVIDRETQITITIFDETAAGFEKKTYKKVRIVALNPFLDLALLKIEDMGDIKTPFVCLGSSSDVRVGQNVFAIGNPLGLERTLSEGAITTTSRAFEGLVYIQTNADINPGNSGGPLFDMSGQVVGVTNMGAVFFGGLGFAIPVDMVKLFLDNHQAFAYDKDNPNSGYRYLQPDARLNKKKPQINAASSKQ